MQAPSEQLGAFYLGAYHDLDTGQRSDSPLVYDARDLTTHAVCVGMTGSGKTGLCIGLLEEAGMDRIPALILDPKGDLTNLMLQFPELRPQDFQPWVNVDDARRRGQGIEEYAENIAQTWRKGLADWGQGSDRIRMLQETVEYTIYTPGSDAGVPINILGSLAAPRLDFNMEAEAIQERISGTVAALLGLIGSNADPIRSREAILLSTIFDHFWRQGRNLDLAQIIMAIQNPPVRTLGVFEVDTFYPERDRFNLAMAFNSLMAAPSFQTWLTGEPLDIDRLFFTDQGKPRHAIIYLAHLSDSERMFFVTLILEALITWMRQQTGTTSLRALLYFDEIFGFFPPVQEPPSKRPILTLMKQARAFGLGVVLVSQNPVDIDYKGLTNAGTWFIGRLQAERDKERVLSGLRGAIAEAGRSTPVNYDEIISRLGSRVFLMHSVHEDLPVVFQTRWAMSYLRGPLTRPQVRQLMGSRSAAGMAPAPGQGFAPPPPAGGYGQMPPQPGYGQMPPQPGYGQMPPQPGYGQMPPQPGYGQPGMMGQPDQPVAPFGQPPSQAPMPGQAMQGQPEIPLPAGFAPTLPSLDAKVAQTFLPVAMSGQEALARLAQESGQAINPLRVQLGYEPGIIGVGTVRFVDQRRNINERKDKVLLREAPSGVIDPGWAKAETVPINPSQLDRAPQLGDAPNSTLFAPVPESANTERKLRSLATEFSDHLYHQSALPINIHEALGVFQRPDEDERGFRIRLQDAARERRDEEINKLEEKYSRQLDRLNQRLRKHELTLVQREADHSSRKQQEILNVGETVFNLLMGRRSSKVVSSVASKRSMTVKAATNIERTRQEMADLESEIAELEESLQDEADAITRRWADLLSDIQVTEIKPRRTDVTVSLVALAWKPYWLVTYENFGGLRTERVAAYPVAGE